MKVKLLVNLKTNKGIVSAGKIFESPLPEYIEGNLSNPRVIQVLVADEPKKVVSEGSTDEPKKEVKAKSLVRKSK